MAEPLAIGTSVVVITAPALDGDRPRRSEPTTITAIQWITEDGEITDEPQAQWQYLLDQEEPFPDTAVLPEYVEAI
jgi:hypothetical protein